MSNPNNAYGAELQRDTHPRYPPRNELILTEAAFETPQGPFGLLRDLDAYKDFCAEHHIISSCA
jgi:hypothetical protein